MKNGFSALCYGATQYCWQVDYFDDRGNKIGNESFTFRSCNKAASSLPTAFDFTPPPYTVKTLFSLESEAEEGSVGFANAVVKPGTFVRKMPQHYWKGCWIWDDAPVMADVHLL